jgi:hypothetical protein
MSASTILRTIRLGLFPLALAMFTLGVSRLVAQAEQSSAQIPPSGAPRDPLALAALTSALKALGGSQAFTAMSDLTVTGTCSGQSADGSPATATFKWVTAGREFLYENTTSAGKTYIASGHGHPWSSDSSGAVESLSPSAGSHDRTYFAPGLLLLKSFADQTALLTYIGTEQLNGLSVTHIQTERSHSGYLMPSTLEDWYFDPRTSLPVQYGYVVPSQQAENYVMHVAVQYNGFKAFGIIAAPSSLTFSIDGAPQPSTCSINSADSNTSPLPVWFDAPTGGSN